MDKWGAPAQTSVLHFGFALWRRKTLHFNTSLWHWRRITLYKKHSGRGDPPKSLAKKIGRSVSFHFPSFLAKSSSSSLESSKGRKSSLLNFALRTRSKVFPFGSIFGSLFSLLDNIYYTDFLNQCKYYFKLISKK